MLSCEAVQSAVSARLDGESYSLSDDVIDAHLAGCAECRAFYEQAVIINRTLAFSAVADSEESTTTVPDLSEVILAGVEPQWRRQAARRMVSQSCARVGLAILGVGWVIAAVALLVTSQQVNPIGSVDYDAHFAELAAHDAATRCALAFGLFFTAWQPRIAGGVVPVFGALWMFSFGFCIRDIVIGTVTYSNVTYLVLLLLSVLCLGWTWLSSNGWFQIRELASELRGGPRQAG